MFNLRGCYLLSAYLPASLLPCLASCARSSHASRRRTFFTQTPLVFVLTRRVLGCSCRNRAVNPDGREGVRGTAPQPVAQLARLQGHGQVSVGFRLNRRWLGRYRSSSGRVPCNPLEIHSLFGYNLLGISIRQVCSGKMINSDI